MVKPVRFDDVRRMALSMPGVEEGTTYGAAAFFVRGRMFACQPTHRSAEAGSLVVRIDFDQREELLAAEPEVYYVTDHYVNYAAVLVRLSRIHRDAVRDLLRSSYAFMSRQKPRVRAGTRARIPARTRR
jgi:hypothetical protein